MTMPQEQQTALVNALTDTNWISQQNFAKVFPDEWTAFENMWVLKDPDAMPQSFRVMQDYGTSIYLHPAFEFWTNRYRGEYIDGQWSIYAKV